MVKHEDLREDFRDHDGQNEYDGEEYDSASSEEEIDVPLSASLNHVSLPYDHPPPNGNGNGLHSSSTKPLMDFTSLGSGLNNGNGHYNHHINEIGASEHAADGRRMSFNGHSNVANSSMGMSGSLLQRQQAQHQPALNGYPYQQQYTSNPAAHGQQQAYLDQNANTAYQNGSNPSHSASFSHQDNQGAFPKPQIQHQQSHHVESSVRFIPGFLSAIHGDTPTPSPPNGFSQNNIGHRQHPTAQQAQQPIIHQQNTQNGVTGMGAGMAVNGSNGSTHLPLGARTMSNDDHAKLQLMLPPSNTGQQTDQNGMVSSGYNIALAHVAASAVARNNSSSASGNANRDGKNARVGSTWTENDSLQGMQHQQQASQFPQLPVRPDVVFDQDSAAGRGYVGINVRSSSDGGASKIEAGLTMLIGEDGSKEVGPGVGSAASAETTSSVRALKMDLGEEGHDAANE